MKGIKLMDSTRQISAWMQKIVCIVVSVCVINGSMQASLLSRTLAIGSQRTQNLASAISLPCASLMPSILKSNFHYRALSTTFSNNPFAKIFGKNTLFNQAQSGHKSNNDHKYYKSHRYIYNGVGDGSLLISGAFAAALWGVYKGSKYLFWNRKDIHYCVNQNDVSQVEYLLSMNKNLLEKKDTELRTPLINAARLGNITMVELLLKHGAIINIIDGTGYTPLMYAAINGQGDLVQLLIENGAALEFTDPYGRTAFFLTVFEDRSDKLDDSKDRLRDFANRANCINIFAQAKANLESKYFNSSAQVHYTPFLWAVANNKSSMAKILLDNGANINAVDSRGWTALHFAVHFGYHEMVKWLLLKKINTKIMPSPGYTPLYLAQSHYKATNDSKYKKVIDLLESHEKNVGSNPSQTVAAQTVIASNTDSNATKSTSSSTKPASSSFLSKWFKFR